MKQLKNGIYTAESVTEGHPDKLCDLIADSILDAYLEKDPQAYVACEVMATKGRIVVAGEITSCYEADTPLIVRQILDGLGYDPYEFMVQAEIKKQSMDIRSGITKSLENRRNVCKRPMQGAGDQGIMVGYATDETKEMMPLPVMLVHRITANLMSAYYWEEIRSILPDGKAQVSVEYADGIPVRLDTAVISVQHKEDVNEDTLSNELTEKVLLPMDEDTKILINPSGRFVLGGLDADTGLTGRKLMVDTYGSFAPHGGGAFSGKDPSKVDRTGAYMARYIAKNLVAAGLCSECQVILAYAIGAAEPVSVKVNTFGTGEVCADDCLEQAVKLVFDLTPQGMISRLGLTKVNYRSTACYGHFGRIGFPWEQTDQAGQLRDTVL